MCVIRIGKLNKKAEIRKQVVTNSIAEIKKILNSKWKLKEGDDKYKFAYVKPDQPLVVRKEWSRLKEAMIKEKKTPANVGCE